MKRMTDEELKRVQLDILKYIDKVCEENNIKYTLSCGTLLGAIRHGGFIPWDDDIDISMIREEYDKFLKIIYSKKNEKYRILSMKDRGYWYTYAKLSDQRTFLKEKNWPSKEEIGVNVDIFPIDYVKDENFEKVNSEYRKLASCLENNLTDIAYKSDSQIKRIIKKIIRRKSVREARKKDEWYWKEKINEYVESMQKSRMRSFLATDLKPCEASVFDTYIKINFEGVKFQSVKNYDQLLTAYYGDYMKLPPKEKQVSNHDFVAYWK